MATKAPTSYSFHAWKIAKKKVWEHEKMKVKLKLGMTGVKMLETPTRRSVYPHGTASVQTGSGKGMETQWLPHSMYTMHDKVRDDVPVSVEAIPILSCTQVISSFYLVRCGCSGTFLVGCVHNGNMDIGHHGSHIRTQDPLMDSVGFLMNFGGFGLLYSGFPYGDGSISATRWWPPQVLSWFLNPSIDTPPQLPVSFL